MKISIVIGSQQKGFLIALAVLLEEKYNFDVKIIARDKNVKHLVNKLLPERSADDVILSDIHIESSDVKEEMQRLEDKYKTTASLLISEDRALGQGYLMNAEKVPHIKRSLFSNEYKLNQLMVDIKKKEIALSGSDVVIGHIPDKVTNLVCESKNIVYMCPTMIKFGDRFFWCTTPYLTSKKYIDRVVANIESDNVDEQFLPYQIEAGSQKNHATVKYTYSFAFKQSIGVFINESKKYILRRQMENSYNFCGWIPSIFRRVYNYNYLKAIGTSPKEINGDYRLVYFTLHLEPEIALQSFSPEFNNSMEAIIWLSKSLPANSIIVVKEHPFSFGIRSRWYYRQLNKIGNVVWANPEVHTWEWIKCADIVATITGTVGVESVHFNKPVISFGRHQVINYLPTVRYVSNFAETRDAVTELLSDNISEEDFHKSRSALTKAQLDSSFDLPEYKNSYDSSQIETKMAKIALENMFSEHPYLYKKQVNE